MLLAGIFGGVYLLLNKGEAQPDPTPNPSPTIDDVIGSGTYTVGTDIPAGRYHVEPNGYYGSISISVEDDYLFSGYKSFYRPIYIELRDGDEFSLESAKAYPFDERPTPNGAELEGSYLIGEDLPAGTYVVISTDPNWEYVDISLSSDMRWTIDSELTYYPFGLKYAVVEVEDGDYLHIDEGTGYAIADAPAPDINVDGAYRVGPDVEPGYYRVLPIDNSVETTVIVSATSRGWEQLFNEYAYDQLYVDLHEGDYVVLMNAQLTDAENEGSYDLADFSGMLEVGRDIAPGEYQVAANSTYFSAQIMNSLRDPWDVEYLWVDNYGYVTLNEGQYLNVSQGAVVPIDQAQPQTDFANTMLKVGFDIEPGSYRLIPEDTFANYQIYADSTLAFDSLVDWEYTDVETEVMLKEGQYILLEEMRLE
ncbi:MAG: hypothetical protein GX483_05995 [Actinomycetaceae bacterium]|nr:hypothetical protein [Actinomycetaceae bacterium]